MRKSLVLWGKWVLANAFGVPLGIIVGYKLNEQVGFYIYSPAKMATTIIDTNSLPEILINALAIGVFTGILQWIILRKMMERAVFWIGASILGWGLGVYMRGMVQELLSVSDALFPEALVGLSVGIMQWLVLRKTFYDIGLWVIVSTVVNAFIAILITRNSLPLFEVGWWPYSLVGAFCGAIMGVLLVYLVKFPNDENDDVV